MILRRFVPILAVLLVAGCSGEKPAVLESGGASEDAAEPAPSLSEEADEARFASRYTSLKDCKLVDSQEGEDWSVSRCPGLGGYALVLNYGDARDDLALRKAGRKDLELGLPNLAGGGFNTLGDTIEWRGSAAGGGFVPVALIVRNSAVRGPEQPEQPTSLLVVVDLAQSCVVAQVKPGASQNERARAMADGPRQPCLRSQ
ncbi:MAG: hypothetical protein ACKOPM_14335 [Novosphingobium sp.]